MAESVAAKPLPEAKPKGRRLRRILRGCGRTLRVFLIIALVVIVAGLIYLGQIGLPPGMQDRLTAHLRAQGWDVQFSRLRVSFSRVGLVAENVYLRRANGPQIYARRAQCLLRPRALRRFNVEIATVKLSGARVIWPLAQTNETATTFFVNQIRGELHFREHDVWDLQSLSATVMGARLNLSGTLTNGSLLRDWRVPQLRRGIRAENLAKWRAILQAVQQINFDGPPELVTRFDGDAADLENSRANFMMHVPAVTSPWASGTNILVSAHLNQSPDAGAHPLELDVLFEHGRTPWAQATAFRFKTRMGLDFGRLIAPTNLSALVEAESAEGPWGAADKISGEVQLAGGTADPAGLQTIFNLTAGPLRHEHFDAATAELRATAWHTRSNWFIEALRDLAATNRPWSERLEQLPLEADFSLSGAKAGAVDAEELLVRAKWRWPLATLGVEGKIEEGGLRATGSFNTTNRVAHFDASSNVDPHRVSPLLTERSRNWLTNYQWQAAPQVSARGRFTLPATLRTIDWAREVLPTTLVEGSFDLGPCRYRAVPLDAAKSPFWFSNSVFSLPALEVRRGAGFARGEYTSRPDTKDFHWRLNSQLDPKILSPLFAQPAPQRAFAMVEFSAPPRVSAEVWGRWYDPSRLGVTASVEATNFAIRGQSVQMARSFVTFTNLQIELTEPEVVRPNEHGTASKITIDLREQRMYFTNAQGNLNPYVVARAISTNAAKVVAPYVFAVPPDVQLNGVLDIKSGRRQDDMHFLISGGPFYWEPFHVNRIGGKLHWAGHNIFLNEVIAQLHGGQASGDAKFEIGTNGAQFQFRTDWSDIDLRSLMRDLSPRTNNLEGVIRGNLQILSAHSANRKSWNGRGIVELKDGLLWDFPVFGAFSPVLNAFIPGLGNSRARDGASSFIITNSVIYTTDLEINATAMRMQYNGTFDFDRRIDGRMEAELLRNVPAIGYILSKVFWPVTKIFEYKVTGTLQEPKTEPVYLIPKLLLIPFSPIKAIKDLFGIGAGEQPKTGTP